MSSSPMNPEQFWLENPSALAEYHRRLEENNQNQPENRRVEVLSVEELTTLAKKGPDDITRILGGNGRPDRSPF